MSDELKGQMYMFGEQPPEDMDKLSESIIAYRSIDPEAIARRVADYIWECGQEDGATCDETEIALELVHQTCSPAFTLLKKHKIICRIYDEDGKKVRRPTRSGRPAGVYRFRLAGHLGVSSL